MRITTLVPLVLAVALATLPGCNVNLSGVGVAGTGMTNRAPVIAAFDYSPKSAVGKADTITFTLVANDPEGNALQYVWTSTRGTLTANTGSTVGWKPVKADGSFDAGLATVTVVVNDGMQTSTASVNIMIGADGQATVQKTEINASPAPAASPSTAPSTTPSSTAPSTAPSATPGPNGTMPALGALEEVEPNNDFPQAQELALGREFKGKQTDSDADFVKVSIPAGAQHGFLKLKVDEASEDFTPRLDVYSANKTSMWSKYAPDATTNPFESELAVVPGQAYYIKISNGHDGVPYTFKADFAPVPDAFEPNDGFETAKALTLGTEVDLYLFAGNETPNVDNDEDYFKIEVPANKANLHVVIKNNSTDEEEQNPRVDLYGANKAYLDSAYAPNARADFDQTFELEPTGGTYYLKIGAANCRAASKLTVTAE